jgi:hypothetical protein
MRNTSRTPSIMFALALAAAVPVASSSDVHARQAPTDSAAYIVLFGSDTLAMERWVRTPAGLEAVSVTRSPRTNVRRWSVRFDDSGRVTHVTTADGTTPVQPAGAVPTATGFYAPQAIALAQAAQARDTLAVVQLRAGENLQDFRVRRIGPDLFEVVNAAGAATSRVRLNRHGQLLSLESGSTLVQRVPWFDIDAYATDFAARDARGEAFGALSTEGSTSVTVNGTTVSITYGRPAARGRTIFGGLVPWNRVWRAGANDPTLITVDGPVQVGDVRLEPGTYSLYVIPSRDRWTLGINRGTEMAAAMNPSTEQDAGRTSMAVRTVDEYVERFTISLDQPATGGAVLRLRWENTEATVPVRSGSE